MIRISLFLILALLPASVPAQGPTPLQQQVIEPEQSNIEIFGAKTGTLIEKQYEDIDVLKNVKVQAAIFTDLIAKTKISGVSFRYGQLIKQSGDWRAAYLDIDEIDAMIKSIEIIKDKMSSSKSGYSEVVFRSKGGIELRCASIRGNWNTIIRLDRLNKNFSIGLDQDDLARLSSLLLQAKQRV